MGTKQVSGKTFGDLITAARIRADDNDASGYFATAVEMTSWANDARRKAALDSGCFQFKENIDLTSNTLEYAITSPYARLHAVQYVDSAGGRKGLIKGTPAEVGHLHDVLEPVKYYEFNGEVGIYPVLAARTTEIVTLYLSEIVYDDVADGDAVDTPAILDEALIWYMIAQQYWKDDRFSAHAQAMAKFDTDVYKARKEFYPGFDE